MKRLLALGVLALFAIASIVVAQTSGTQSSGQGTLRLTTGDRPFTYVLQSGQAYVSAAEVTQGLGGTLEADSNGFKVSIGGVVAAFGPDSRYGVIRDDLIEMPVPPITIEGNAFGPWQFFQGVLAKSSQSVIWDAATRSLTVRPQQRDTVGVQVSLANVQGISKIVLTLSASAEYGVLKEPGAFVVRFRTPVRAPFGEQAYEDPYVAKLTFAGSDLRIHLTNPDVVGDAYQLENPPRIVLDLRQGTAASATAPVVTPTPSRPRDTPGIHTIVIDPGHGGKEVGAVGPGGVFEKDLTLQLCQKLASALSNKTGARVVLTREDDSIVSLDQRTAIANQYNADLFLSVHLNAAVVPNAKGSETYYLSLEASDELARKAAETENAAGAADPASDLKLILWDLAQQTYIGESSRFAQAIQEEMSSATGAASRGVKQAPFKVLVGATMPAALVEVGFISNPEEEARLQTGEFQAQIVEAIANAVARYKTDYETRIGVAPAPAAPAAATVPGAPKPAASTPATTTSAPAAQTRTER
jgi:N-acetylmuramoyl-L-alanine amidase